MQNFRAKKLSLGDIFCKFTIKANLMIWQKIPLLAKAVHCTMKIDRARTISLTVQSKKQFSLDFLHDKQRPCQKVEILATLGNALVIRPCPHPKSNDFINFRVPQGAPGMPDKKQWALIDQKTPFPPIPHLAISILNLPWTSGTYREVQVRSV